jgi:PAS domain S-box-containing protein
MEGLGGALIALICLVAGTVLGLLIGRNRTDLLMVRVDSRRAQAEARAEAILEAAVDGVVVIDERGIVQSFSRAAERTFGYRADEVVGRNVNLLMPEPYRGEHDSYIRNYLATGRAKVIGSGREVTGLRKDGSTFPMDLAVGESRFAGRRLFAGFVRDITRRKETEQRLRESETRNRAILEAAVDGIITIGEDGIIHSANSAAERIFGYRTAEIVGRNVSMLMPDPDRSAHDRYLRNYLTTGRAKIIGIGREVTGLRKDGSTFPMDLAVGESVVDGHRIFAGMVRDITDRKAVEERLRTSEERFRALVEGVPDWSITSVDTSGLIASWNLGAERIYGWTAEEAVGSSVARFYPLEATARGEHLRALKIAAEEGRFEEENWRVRKDASRFWAHVVVIALRDEAGALRGYARISHDMTEQKRHEDALRAAKEEAQAAARTAEAARAEAERANMAKTKFLAAAGHDLRQPVQAIYFFASVLAHKLKGHAAQSILADLQNSLEGLSLLLDSLLDVSRLDAKLVAPKEIDFSVGAVLDRVAAEFAPLARDKHIELRTVPSTALVRSDPALLSRVVQNLVSNAVRYTQSGRVLLGCRRRGDTIRIEVWDTGIGIPPERLPEIFEEFTQLGNPERDRAKGLGLGLAIVDRLVRLLGHRIEVHSQPGRGSMFAVEVGIGHLVRAAERRRQHKHEAEDRLVVVIDDEAMVLKSLAMVLQSWGFRVVAAGSQEEAVAKLGPQPPSFILADYRLRDGHTGTEAVAHLRDHFHDDIPSIIITGDTAPERLREAEASGLSILHKPVHPPDLREAMRGLDDEGARRLH